MRILIIEDEITLNRTLQEGLIDFGYQVDTAENYKDAEYFIDIRNYDLVLTDWMLPDGDGIELCKIVKNRSSRTAVVIISARDDKESEIEALKSGADDFIKKPFDFDILLARIEARLRFGGTNIIDCLLYTSDAADERSSVDLGGRRIIKKKKIASNLILTVKQTQTQ